MRLRRWVCALKTERIPFTTSNQKTDQSKQVFYEPVTAESGVLNWESARFMFLRIQARTKLVVGPQAHGGGYDLKQRIEGFARLMPLVGVLRPGNCAIQVLRNRNCESKMLRFLPIQN